MEGYNDKTFQTIAREVLIKTTEQAINLEDRIELFVAILEDVYRDGRVVGQHKAIEDFTHDLNTVIEQYADKDSFIFELQGVISDFQEYESED